LVFVGEVLLGSRAWPARRAAPAAAVQALAPDQALLLAGQQVDLSAALGAPRVAEADIVAAASWRMRQLSFDDAGLDEIVTEFNHYNRIPIVLADPSLSSARFSGVFDANDPKSFVAFLELSTSVEVDRTQPDRIVLRQRP